MKKPFKFRIVLWVIVAVLVPIMVYLMMDVGSASEIFKRYDSLKPSSSSSYSKAIAFLNTYIQSTGDISLAEAVGVPEEELQQYIDPPAGGGGGNSVTPPWTSGTVNTALEAKYQGTDIGVSKGCSLWKVQKDGNKAYIMQYQGNSVWGSIQNSSSQSLKSHGCMFFTCSAAISLATGNVVSVDDILTKVGYNVRYQSGAYSIGVYLPKVGYNSDYTYNDGTVCAPDAILNRFGVANAGSNIDTLKSSDFDKCFFLVHAINDATNHYLSSGSSGEHWFLIVGKSGAQYAIVNGSGSAGGSGGSIGYCSVDYVNSHLNNIWKVEMK